MTIAEYLTKEVREELEKERKEKEKARREKEQALREKDEQLQKEKDNAQRELRKEKEKMIFRLFRDGVDLETIARYTDTPVPELEKLLRQRPPGIP